MSRPTSLSDRTALTEHLITSRLQGGMVRTISQDEPPSHAPIEYFRDDIGTRGFTITTDAHTLRERGMTYTIGLADWWNHPELLIAGYPFGEAIEMLFEAGDLVVSGRHRFDRRRRTYYRDAAVAVVTIPEDSLRSLMPLWHRVYANQAEVPRLKALQFVVPDGGDSCWHQKTQQLLGPLVLPRHHRKGSATADGVVIRLPR